MAEAKKTEIVLIEPCIVNFGEGGVHCPVDGVALTIDTGEARMLIGMKKAVLAADYKPPRKTEKPEPKK